MELLPLIKECFNKHYVDIGICGRYIGVEKELRMNITSETIEVPTLYDFYDEYMDAMMRMDADILNRSMQKLIKPIVNTSPKIGRNEACPCGSGKKFKRCHGMNN